MICRALMVETTRGVGATGDPVRMVKVFYDDKTLAFICEHDAWAEQNKNKELERMYHRIVELERDADPR